MQAVAARDGEKSIGGEGEKGAGGDAGSHKELPVCGGRMVGAVTRLIPI